MKKQTNKIILVLTFILLLQVHIVDATNYPKLTEHVTDYANIIDPVKEAQITELATKIEKDSTVEIAVLTIDSLQGENASKYAVSVGQLSRIGKKDRNNGLLILIAMDDGKGGGKGAYFVATGYGLASILPDEIVDKINDDVLLPYLKKGKETKNIKYYGQGIYEEMLVFEGFFNNDINTILKYRTFAPTSTPSSSISKQDVPTSSVNLYGEKTDIIIGDSIILKLSAVNPITNPKMTIQTIMIPPSGWSVTSSAFSKVAAGQFATNYELESGDGRDIEITMMPNQVGEFAVTGKIIYYLGDDKNNAEYYILNLPLKVREKESGITNAKETQSGNNAKHQEKSPGFEIIFIVIAILLSYVSLEKIK